MTPYELAQHLAHVPEPFAVGGPQELWTDPHVQERMLALHLDPDIAAASRDHAFVARSLDWIVDRFEVHDATRVLDLGCGPGLYANPLAEHGARVHGIDLSAVAIDAARQGSTSQRATTPGPPRRGPPWQGRPSRWGTTSPHPSPSTTRRC